MTVRKFVDLRKIAEDVSIRSSELNSCFVEQSSLFVHYARLSAEAAAQVSAKKLTVETIRAKIDKAIRETAVKDGRKITENAIDQEIALDTTYLKAKMEVIEAEAEEAGVRAIVEGMRHRKDMLIQLGADAREELKGELRMSATPHIDAYRANK